VRVLVLGLLERRRRLFLDALGYRAWEVGVSWPISQVLPGCRN
jgi:hypothetical protein